MYKTERDLVLNIKMKMSRILTLYLMAEDKGLDMEDIKQNLIVNTNEYYNLLDDLRTFDEEELLMMDDNFSSDLNFMMLLVK